VRIRREHHAAWSAATRQTSSRTIALVEVTDWLRDADPALRWQVERDLLDLPPAVWEATRARIATEGFGARLLACQDADGQWAGGAYFPAAVRDGELGQPDATQPPSQPWTATTWALNTLRDWGLDAGALAGTAAKLEANSRWEYDDLPYWGGEVDCCINAFTLANGTWLGADVSSLPGWFVEHQLDDGGWNCEWVNGARRSSFHSTLNALRGLLFHEVATGGTHATRAARRAGEEYLLQRGLMHRRSTGERVGPWVAWLPYPFRWHYTALRALDHFRAAAEHDGTPPDPRLEPAVQVVAGRRRDDGRWTTDGRAPGAVWFEVDVPAGEPSTWVTFHAARVLRWWEGRDA
jgi:hypothetical protein